MLVGAPARVRNGGAPDLAVARIFVPRAVVAQVPGDEVNVCRQPVAAVGVGELTVAAVVPPVPAIRVGQAARAEGGVGVGDVQIAPGFKHGLVAAALDGGAAPLDGDFDVAVHADPDFGRAFRLDGNERGIDLIDGLGGAQLQRGQPLAHLKLGELAVGVAEQGLQGHDRPVAQPEQAAVVELHFRPPAVRHPHLRPLPDGQVDRGGRPGRTVGRPPGHVALDIGEPRQPDRPRPNGGGRLARIRGRLHWGGGPAALSDLVGVAHGELT